MAGAGAAAAPVRRFRLPARRRPRRPSLTPMIDVVFLLLVFFMLAARFGTDRALPLAAGGGAGAAWEGPPRLVTVSPGGLALNGTPVAPADLAAALAPLMPSPDAPVILRGTGDARLEDVTRALEALAGAGPAAGLAPRVILVE